MLGAGELRQCNQCICILVNVKNSVCIDRMQMKCLRKHWPQSLLLGVLVTPHL